MIRRLAASMALSGALLALSGCVTTTISTGDPSTTAPTATGTADAGPPSACAEFFETPSYESSVFFGVLLSAGGSGDVTSVDRDVASAVDRIADGAHEGASEDLRTISRAAVRDASLDDLRTAVTNFGSDCSAEGDTTAAYAIGEGEAGAKPADLTCADVLSKPQTLTVFANSNVLPSNSFKIVGMSTSRVKDQGKADAVAEDLQAEIDATSDPELKRMLTDLRQPFLGEGSGVKAPLGEITTYCEGLS